MKYNNLTFKLLDDLLSDLTNTSDKSSFVCYTGLGGMRAFDWVLFLKFTGIIGDISIKHYHHYDMKKVKFRYINLLTKKGDYRLKVYSNKENNIELYKGTNFIMSTNNFKDINEYNFI